MNKQNHNPKTRTMTLLLRISAVAVLICLAFTAFAVYYKSGINPATACNGVVLVAAKTVVDGKVDSFGTGTGWAIGKLFSPVQYIVTNAHVVEDAYLKPNTTKGASGEIEVYFSAAEHDAVTVQVVYYSEPKDKDIAILKLPSPTNKRRPLILRDITDVKQGDSCYALGHPGLARVLQENMRIDVKDVTVTNGVISKRIKVQGRNYEAFQMDTMINPGNSGGPLIDPKGFVLGVNTLGLTETINEKTSISLNINYASTIDNLQRILREEQLPFQTNRSFDWMLYTFAPIALIFFALAFYAAQNLKRSPATVNNQKANQAHIDAPKAQEPLIRGISGQFAGESFNLKDKTLVLGRDSTKCNIVFNAATPGISGSHCSISYDEANATFILTDLGSSFGTFVGSGRKLSAHVPEKLSVNESFYLGDPGNRFSIGKENR